MKQSFPLIVKLGLNPISIPSMSFSSYYFFSAEDLESALEKATVVYGFEGLWSVEKDKGDTRQALLICVEELPREPLKHEYKTKIESCDGWLQMPQSFKGKNVKITIEEIKDETR